MAWIGDAVLALWAREKVLRERGELVTEMFLQLTGNAFLQTIARPTQVEAEIGAVYQRSGLATAFAYIEARILPVYESQAASRRRKAQKRR